MSTCETDLDKPENVIATLRTVCIIHPSRKIYAKLSFFKKMFPWNTSETYILDGNPSEEITPDQIGEFLKKNNLKLSDKTDESSFIHEICLCFFIFIVFSIVFYLKELIPVIV